MSFFLSQLLLVSAFPRRRYPIGENRKPRCLDDMDQRMVMNVNRLWVVSSMQDAQSIFPVLLFSFLLELWAPSQLLQRILDLLCAIKM